MSRADLLYQGKVDDPRAVIFDDSPVQVFATAKSICDFRDQYVTCITFQLIILEVIKDFSKLS